MPQSLANILLHVVFSTNDRKPFLRAEQVRSKMNAYTIRNLLRIQPSMTAALGNIWPMSTG